jgi:hypothetical protein
MYLHAILSVHSEDFMKDFDEDGVRQGYEQLTLFLCKPVTWCNILSSIYLLLRFLGVNGPKNTITRAIYEQTVIANVGIIPVYMVGITCGLIPIKPDTYVFKFIEAHFLAVFLFRDFEKYNFGKSSLNIAILVTALYVYTLAKNTRTFIGDYDLRSVWFLPFEILLFLYIFGELTVKYSRLLLFSRMRTFTLLVTVAEFICVFAILFFTVTTAVYGNKDYTFIKFMIIYPQICTVAVYDIVKRANKTSKYREEMNRRRNPLYDIAGLTSRTTETFLYDENDDGFQVIESGIFTRKKRRRTRKVS